MELRGRASMNLTRAIETSDRADKITNTPGSRIAERAATAWRTGRWRQTEAASLCPNRIFDPDFDFPRILATAIVNIIPSPTPAARREHKSKEDAFATADSALPVANVPIPPARMAFQCPRGTKKETPSADRVAPPMSAAATRPACWAVRPRPSTGDGALPTSAGSPAPMPPTY